MKATRPKIEPDDAKGWRKEARHFRKHLVDLTNATLEFLAEFDKLMAQPFTVEREKRLAALATRFEMSNDLARYFGLGIDRKNDKRTLTK